MRLWNRVSSTNAAKACPERSRRDEQLPARVLIGGVGYRWFGDASFGLVATDQLAGLDWPSGVEVADLGYGAIYVAQDLGAAQPPYERLILICGMARGRQPGQIYYYHWTGAAVDGEEIQARIREAGAGVIDLDHLLVIAQHFSALPDDVVVVEVEPVETTTGEELSTEIAGRLPQVIELVRRQAFAPLREVQSVSKNGGTISW